MTTQEEFKKSWYNYIKELSRLGFNMETQQDLKKLSKIQEDLFKLVDKVKIEEGLKNE